MVTENRRVKKTKKIIADAVWALMQEKNFEDISVNDIAERAEISRTTFYHYYVDKYDWLEKNIGALVLEDFLVITVDTEISKESYIAQLNDTFCHIKEHSFYYSIININSQNRYFQERLDKILLNIARASQHSASPMPLDQDLRLHYQMTVFSGVIQWWVQNNFPTTPEQMAEMTYTIRYRSIPK